MFCYISKIKRNNLVMIIKFDALIFFIKCFLAQLFSTWYCPITYRVYHSQLLSALILCLSFFAAQKLQQDSLADAFDLCGAKSRHSKYFLMPSLARNLTEISLKSKNINLKWTQIHTIHSQGVLRWERCIIQSKHRCYIGKGFNSDPWTKKKDFQRKTLIQFCFAIRTEKTFEPPNFVNKHLWAKLKGRVPKMYSLSLNSEGKTLANKVFINFTVTQSQSQSHEWGLEKKANINIWINAENPFALCTRLGLGLLLFACVARGRSTLIGDFTNH